MDAKNSPPPAKFLLKYSRLLHRVAEGIAPGSHGIVFRYGAPVCAVFPVDELGNPIIPAEMLEPPLNAEQSTSA